MSASHHSLAESAIGASAGGGLAALHRAAWPRIILRWCLGLGGGGLAAGLRAAWPGSIGRWCHVLGGAGLAAWLRAAWPRSMASQCGLAPAVGVGSEAQAKQAAALGKECLVCEAFASGIDSAFCALCGLTMRKHDLQSHLATPDHSRRARVWLCFLALSAHPLEEASRLRAASRVEEASRFARRVATNLDEERFKTFLEMLAMTEQALAEHARHGSLTSVAESYSLLGEWLCVLAQVLEMQQWTRSPEAIAEMVMATGSLRAGLETAFESDCVIPPRAEEEAASREEVEEDVEVCDVGSTASTQDPNEAREREALHVYSERRMRGIMARWRKRMRSWRRHRLARLDLPKGAVVAVDVDASCWDSSVSCGEMNLDRLAEVFADLQKFELGDTRKARDLCNRGMSVLRSINNPVQW